MAAGGVLGNVFMAEPVVVADHRNHGTARNAHHLEGHRLFNTVGVKMPHLVHGQGRLLPGIFSFLIHIIA